MKWQIETTLSPSKEAIDFLTKKINSETPAWGEVSGFGVWVKNGQQEVVGGATGDFIYGSVYTDQLWVEKTCRHQGIATWIMDTVHDLGRERGCKMATIQTMSFQQVLGFYEKLGYQQEWIREGYLNNSSCISLCKKL